MRNVCSSFAVSKSCFSEERFEMSRRQLESSVDLRYGFRTSGMRKCERQFQGGVPDISDDEWLREIDNI